MSRDVSAGTPTATVAPRDTSLVSRATYQAYGGIRVVAGRRRTRQVLRSAGRLGAIFGADRLAASAGDRPHVYARRRPHCGTRFIQTRHPNEWIARTDGPLPAWESCYKLSPSRVRSFCLPLQVGRSSRRYRRSRQPWRR